MFILFTISLKVRLSFKKLVIILCKLQLEIINAHSLLGFSKSENIINIPCVSSKPVNAMAITNVFLEHGYDLGLSAQNMDNHKSDKVQSNSII